MAVTTDVVIIGGGIIGTSIAYCCARAGLNVTVVDRREPGREASWATAGIIGVQPYEQAKTPFTALLGLGTRLHAEWAEELREETGLEPGYLRTGGIELARDAHEAHTLHSAAGHYRAHGVEWVKLSTEQVVEREPHLFGQFAAVYLVPGMAQIRPPRYMRALVAACQRRGVEFLSGHAVIDFILHGDRVQGVVTQTDEIHANYTVVAAGAWTEGLLKPLGFRLPVRPVRGQVVLLEARADLIRHILMVGRQYVVPRLDGRYLVGSTQEHVGFNRSVTVDGIRKLLDFAAWLCPELGRARIESAWSGFRPSNPDGKPFIGGTQRYQGLLFATGHFRSGVLAAPATALLIQQLICGEEPVVPLWPFNPDRPIPTGQGDSEPPAAAEGDDDA